MTVLIQYLPPFTISVSAVNELFATASTEYPVTERELKINPKHIIIDKTAEIGFLIFILQTSIHIHTLM